VRARAPEVGAHRRSALGTSLLRVLKPGTSGLDMTPAQRLGDARNCLPLLLIIIPGCGGRRFLFDWALIVSIFENKDAAHGLVWILQMPRRIKSNTQCLRGEAALVDLNRGIKRADM